MAGLDDGILARLERWFAARCNGDWEHTNGVKIQNLDSPGWLAIVEVLNTDLFGVKFDSVQEDQENGQWIRCDVKEGVFQGAGGLGSLNRILEIFLDWAEAVR
jgi:hypothetical protein